MLRYSGAVRWVAAGLAIAWLVGCGLSETESDTPEIDYRAMVDDYVPVKLEADLSGLTDNQRAMLPLLVSAARVMDSLFWQQAYGDKNQLLDGIDDLDARRFAEINYGPWDRLGDNRPFLPGIGPKPPGANYYPADLTKEELEQAAASEPGLTSQYTLVRRDDSRDLIAVPYNKAFANELSKAASLLRQAAELAEDPGFRRYLGMRATALETNVYQQSDFAWMDMRDNVLDLVIGPIESYEDKLMGTKTAFEAYVLVKDRDWSARLERYSAMLPMLQDGLPVPAEYKAEDPGGESQLNAYDVLFYAGDCNAGAKTIAINLPNDEQVQLEKGSRRLQLKNAMRAKFDKILIPIADVLVAEDQRDDVNFEAFFANIMFHEVAHGLGIKKTLDGRGTVRDALKEASSALEEAKADILGLHLLARLTDQGAIPSGRLDSNYITFLAGIFRSVRFGASSAHGTANLLSFNYFEKAQAFSRDRGTGTYRVNIENMRSAVDALSGEILRLQGDGDYGRATRFLADLGRMGDSLENDLARLEDLDIPVDIVFEQEFVGAVQ
ncbi:MAG: hypothetical protein OXC19_19745 [Bryobacterales bacterium]|nr:hypothetical protein [Bryobacterales bacterium]